VSAVYFDSSVLMAYYVPEVHSAQAERIMHQTADRVVSPLCLCETEVALSARVAQGRLQKDDAWAARNDLKAEYGDGYYRSAAIQSVHFQFAAQLAWQCGLRLRALDALHVAIAQAEGCQLAGLRPSPRLDCRRSPASAFFI
jgi:predicted nucleic acid-binding protein